MDVKIKALSALFVAAVILGSIPLVVSANGNENEWPLGKDIAASFDGILSAHQTDIDTFIIGHKDLMAETQEERLDILEEELGSLRAKIGSINTAREQFIAQLQNDDITDEEFGQEMRALATDLNGVGETGRKLGQRLGVLGKTLAGELKTHAEDLADDLEACGDEATLVANAVLVALKGAGVPVPQAVFDALEDAGLSVGEAADGVPEGIPGEAEVPDEAKIPEEVPPEEPPIPEEPGEEGEVPEGVPP